MIRPSERKTGKWLRSSVGEIGVGALATIDDMRMIRAPSPSASASVLPSGDHAGAWQANVHCWLASLERTLVMAAGPLPSRPTIQRSITPVWYVKNAIRLPSGLQLGKLALTPSLVI